MALNTTGSLHATVVVATRNRRDLVCTAVRTLLAQDWPCSLYAVIVVCDRCTDGTEEALVREFGAAVHVMATGPASSGLAAARDIGWRSAREGIVIFVDDEIRASRGFVSAHVRAHESEERVGITGYSPIVLGAQSTRLHAFLARELEAFYKELARPGRVSTPRDLAGFNFSLRSSALQEIGGFGIDNLLGERDDFELAQRLLEAGYKFRYCPDARAEQTLATSEARLLERARFRALKDADLARRHPGCIPHLPFAGRMASPAPRFRAALLWALASPIADVLGLLRRLGLGHLRLSLLEHEALYFATLRNEFSWRELVRMCRQHD